MSGHVSRKRARREESGERGEEKKKMRGDCEGRAEGERRGERREEASEGRRREHRPERGGASEGGWRGKGKGERDEGPPATLEILAEIFCWDRAATQARKRLSWRDPPNVVETTRRPHPHPRDTPEERIELCLKDGTPPLEEDWAIIKQWGCIKQCILAIMQDHD
jgi:hypothetical protein